MALEKKSGGLRPIAVGEILRRLVGKFLCAQSKQSINNYFWPRQVGVGAPLGADCAIHTVRQWCQRHGHDDTKMILKLDFENAFNTVDRSEALSRLCEHFPHLSRWAQWCYGAHSHLFFGPMTLASATRVQQGDPLDPCCSLPASIPLCWV